MAKVVGEAWAEERGGSLRLGSRRRAAAACLAALGRRCDAKRGEGSGAAPGRRCCSWRGGRGSVFLPVTAPVCLLRQLRRLLLLRVKSRTAQRAHGVGVGRLVLAGVRRARVDERPEVRLEAILASRVGA